MIAFSLCHRTVRKYFFENSEQFFSASWQEELRVRETAREARILKKHHLSISKNLVRIHGRNKYDSPSTRYRGADFSNFYRTKIQY